MKNSLTVPGLCFALASNLIFAVSLTAQATPFSDQLSKTLDQTETAVSNSYEVLIVKYEVMNLLLLDLRNVHQAGDYINSIVDPDNRQTVKTAVYAIPLLASGNMVRRLWNGVGGAFEKFPKTTGSFRKAGLLFKGIINPANIILAGITASAWKNAPVLFLNQDEYDAAVMKTQIVIDSLEEQLKKRSDATLQNESITTQTATPSDTLTATPSAATGREPVNNAAPNAELFQLEDTGIQ